MVIKTTKGYFEIVKNVRDAFNLEQFQNKYLEEYFDSSLYIVGDISSNTLRLKGFSVNPGSSKYYKNIPDYLCESCAYRGAYYILRRINENEFNTLKEKYSKHPNSFVTDGEGQGFVIEKQPFDKDQLVLESSEPRSPHIVLDMNRINSIKTYSLPSDLKEDPKTLERYNKENKSKSNKNKKEDNSNRVFNTNNKKAFSNQQKNNKAFSNKK